MKIFTDAKAALLLHKLIFFRFLLFSFGSLATATLTALAGMQWSTSDWQTRFMVVVGIFASCATSMAAFLDRSMAKIAQGENPFVDIPSPPAPGTVEKTVTSQVTEIKTPPINPAP